MKSGLFVLKISIHAPRAGSDFAFSSGSMLPLIFQSTLPVRGATSEIKNGPAKKDISIHAPRAGSDSTRGKMGLNNGTFQSTLPVRGAT